MPHKRRDLPGEMAHRDVRVYKNLHNGAWSVQGYIPGKGWRVLGHASQVLLRDVSFIVNETTRQRMHARYAATGKRANVVHAYAYGVFCSWHDRYGNELPLTYNPWTERYVSVQGSGRAVHYAEWAYCDTDRVWSIAPMG